MQVLFCCVFRDCSLRTKRRHRSRGSELSASCGRVSETENGQEQGELRTNVSKATLFQPGLNLGGLSEGEHLAAFGGSELFPFCHGLRRDTFPISWGQLWGLVHLTPSPVHPPSGGFHMAEPYFTLQGNISPVRRTDFTAHVSALSGAEFYRHPIAAPLRHPKNPVV